MLLDYQQNGFFFGTERQKNAMNEKDVIPHINEIQDALSSHRTKLRAALARSRIRDCAISVEALLPEEEQEKMKCAARQPVYGRVNILKTTVDVVINTLREDGFLLEDDLPENEELTGRNFMMDCDFDNLLVFSPEIKFELYSHELVQSSNLIIQVRKVCASMKCFQSGFSNTCMCLFCLIKSAISKVKSA